MPVKTLQKSTALLLYSLIHKGGVKGVDSIARNSFNGSYDTIKALKGLKTLNLTRGFSLGSRKQLKNS